MPRLVHTVRGPNVGTGRSALPDDGSSALASGVDRLAPLELSVEDSAYGQSSHNAQVERLEVVDTGRRRRWSEEEKLRIVAESLSGP
jgi:hypothetical protein